VALTGAPALDDGAWIAVALLAVVCTGLAYLLFFRLIAHVGATQALAVTLRVPAFRLLWGACSWPGP
jgi:drug/metabolite transporter (DMT)-like permease